MNKYFSFALAVWVLIVSMAEPLQAEGFYLSTDLGMNFGKSLNMYGHDTDRPSVCDEYINPAFMTVNSTLGWTNTNCTGPNRGSDSVWENDFGSDEGVLFGTALGYYIGDSSFRAELEYFYRNTNYNETSETTVGGGEVLSKLVQEIVRAEERIGHLASHNLFANLYMDFANSSRFTPYVGLGLGTGFAGLQYNGVFARDIDPARITTGNAPEGGQPLANAAPNPSEPCRHDHHRKRATHGYAIWLSADGGRGLRAHRNRCCWDSRAAGSTLSRSPTRMIGINCAVTRPTSARTAASR